MTEQAKAKRDELADAHPWGIDCTCDQPELGACWYHLSDFEKAKSSYITGFDDGYAERDNETQHVNVGEVAHLINANTLYESREQKLAQALRVIANKETAGEGNKYKSLQAGWDGVADFARATLKELGL